MGEWQALRDPAARIAYLSAGRRAWMQRQWRATFNLEWLLGEMLLAPTKAAFRLIPSCWGGLLAVGLYILLMLLAGMAHADAQYAGIAFLEITALITLALWNEHAALKSRWRRKLIAHQGVYKKAPGIIRSFRESGEILAKYWPNGRTSALLIFFEHQPESPTLTIDQRVVLGIWCAEDGHTVLSELPAESAYPPFPPVKIGSFAAFDARARALASQDSSQPPNS
ncbi:hypothetical protein [Magnetofaba australis]|uniref:hypothetical protein n=1 Tax=Magnetofaba australis TaxID=1472297 RepID=UPI000A19B7DD|nr:hypothetical protein [Magnetofaba australis]